MRLVVASCHAYRDTWLPFKKLVDHFWPNHPSITLLSDYTSYPLDEHPFDWAFYSKGSWCQILRNFIIESPKEIILLFQDDFFLSAPVNKFLIERGIDELRKRGAGCVRLYPCPGGISEYGDEHFAEIPRGTEYRISCQAALWDSSYLKEIARVGDTPTDFELKGTPYSNDLLNPVLAFKRDVKPWPLEYLCSAVSRGEWNPDAKKLCESVGINDVDWTMRKFQAA